MERKKTEKAAQTRARIVDVAMTLFREQGYDKTTMREIGRAAGLAQGAAYYHFESKQHLIFDFYRRTYDDQLPEAEAVLATRTGLADRLAGMVEAHLKAAQPYHAVSRILFKSAADPSDPLSPFSEASAALRTQNIELMGRVLEGQKLSNALKQGLPELLWLFKMAMILYWVHDPSPKQEKSFKLARKGAALVADLIRLAKLPGLGRLSKNLLSVYQEFKPF